MNKKFAVVLSGCGVYDGAEIHEATLTLYAIKKNNCSYEIFAPNIEQYHVINHLTGEVSNEKRNALVESARIARGKISDLENLKHENFDAIILPGGFGVAKNLSDFAFKGVECTVNENLSKVIKLFHANKKPIAALCISPAIIAKILGNVKVTIGNDKSTSQAIINMNAEHIEENNGGVVVDKENLIFTSPCYMLDSDISQIGDSALNIIKEVIKQI